MTKLAAIKTTNIIKTFSLKSFPVFACFTDEDDFAYSAKCQMRSYQPGETIVDFGDTSRDVFLVQSGEVRAVLRFSIGKEAILGTFRKGNLFGELSAIDSQTRSASLMAVYASTVICMPAETFREILKTKPDVSLALLGLMSSKIRALNNRITDLCFLDTKHRLYNTLLRLSRSRISTPHERVISPPVVHAELAEHIGSSRETVSREMSKLMREGLVERTSRAIVIRDPSELTGRISKAMAHC